MNWLRKCLSTTKTKGGNYSKSPKTSLCFVYKSIFKLLNKGNEQYHFCVQQAHDTHFSCHFVKPCEKYDVISVGWHFCHFVTYRKLNVVQSEAINEIEIEELWEQGNEK